jgi:hypothetical protein
MPCCSGPLPASLATHAQLQLLSLEHNMLSGPLPAAWVDGWPSAVNSSLQTVYFHSNAFSGGFPAGLAQVPYLQELWMGSNSLRCCWAAATHPLPAIGIHEHCSAVKIDVQLPVLHRIKPCMQMLSTSQPCNDTPLCCSGPLPGGNITVNNNITSRFFALLHVLNITHNGFSGEQHSSSTHATWARRRDACNSAAAS